MRPAIAGDIPWWQVASTYISRQLKNSLPHSGAHAPYWFAVAANLLIKKKINYYPNKRILYSFPYLVHYFNVL